MVAWPLGYDHYFKGGEIYMKKWVAAILMVAAIVAATSANFNIG
jgi:hypothetical protein